MIILKILLIIILSLLTLIAILLVSNVHLYAEFKQELALYIRILFIKIRLLPQKQDKNKAEDDNKKDKDTDTKKVKKSIFDRIKEKGLSDFLSLLEDVLNLVKDTLFPLLCKIKVKNISVDVSVSCDDAAQTAIMYGRYCTVAYPLMSIITEYTNCAKHYISIKPNFDEKAQTEVNAKLNCKCRIIWVLIYSIKFLIGFSKIDK